MSQTMTMGQFNKKIGIWVDKVPGAVKDALKKGAMMIIGNAQSEHLSGPKMPKGVGSRDRATLQPRSGDLKTQLHHRVEIDSNSVSLFVGSNKIYAASHEHGDRSRGIPKRAYLSPSRDRMLPKVVNEMSKDIIKAYEETGKHAGF